MNHNYTRQVQSALRMIYKFGRNVEVVSAGTGDEYDPTTGQFTTASPVISNIKAVFTHFEEKEIDGTNVLRTDEKVLFAAASLSAKPASTDKIKDNGTEYNVVNVNTIQPGDTAILYEVQARR